MKTRKIMQHNKNRSGFTLIEMLVVVAIIGLLSSVVVVGLGSARQNARDARRISDLRQIQNALEVYYSSNNAYPAALTDLPSVPKDPSTGDDYGYTGGDQTYLLGATLEGDIPSGANHISTGNADTIDCSVTTSYCVQS